ncbi:hypothetical protein H072_15 [Dactylellina haptotyla CBS 200.50]|uniref:Uncharacterized protein n=1 Tax=Dactylellina haptotyla (strain CBS 200.50) TaxID=1284197 RepID=S8ASK5_DACHA|nr:hypothetical protein H072_15 [Dactylellina haptotyla CBS 200.50]
MLFQSFPVSLLLLSGILGQVAFASPVARGDDIPPAVSYESNLQARSADTAEQVWRGDYGNALDNIGSFHARRRQIFQGKEADALIKRARVDLAKLSGMTVINFARAINECQQYKKLVGALIQKVTIGCTLTSSQKVPQQVAAPTPTPAQQQPISLWDRITAVPGALWNGIKQIPKIWDSSNVEALKKSANDLGQAFTEIPGAVKSGFNDLTNAQNLEAFKKSFGDLKKGISEVPDAAKSGFDDLKNPQNFAAFEKSLTNLGTALQEIPTAVKNGANDLSKAPGDIAAAFSKAPQQLAQAARDFMKQYNEYLPPGSDRRKLVDALLASVPLQQDTFKTFGLRVGMSGKDINDAVTKVCLN